MAERYYSIHPDDPSKVYMNCNLVQAQAPALQHINSNFVGVTNPLHSDYEYLPNAAYFTTVANSLANTNGIVDANNNRGQMARYYGARTSCGGKQSGNYHQSNHIYTNKVLPSGMATKYTNTGSHMYDGCGGTMLSAAHDSNAFNYHPGISQGHYISHVNSSSYGYQRNRYMPYNRSTSLHHNPLQSTTTVTTCGGLTSSTPALTNGYHQYTSPIYQTCPLTMMQQSLTSSTPLTAVSAQQTLQHSHAPMSSIITSTAAHCSPNYHELTYAHAVASSLAPTTVTSVVPSSSDIKNSISLASVVTTSCGSTCGASDGSSTIMTSTPYNTTQTYATVSNPNDTVTLQITNLDYSMDEASLRNFLLNQLKPITPVVSLTFEGSSYAKVTVPDLYFAKQVVSNLHRKKIGHKRMLVSYTRDSSLTEINTLRCQVAGLLKDVPCYTLPMYKFRELFQSRFKTSISVLDLYKMQDICIINSDNNEEKFISLHPNLVDSLENSPLMEGLQHSVPYCTTHFKREQHKGWAEQEIEPLPNVFMTISEIQKVIHPLLKNHSGDIPVASLVHCIEAQLKIKITPNEVGVNLEHLICCVQGIQISVNNFGIKILSWLELKKENNFSSSNERSNLYSKNSISDPLYQISREVIELVKMSPKSTMKFNRFIPAYHNHFGKQCRVADYGYTKLIELFEALSSVVQIMGDGENRQITLTHRAQIRRFTSDLLRVLRAHGNKSVLLSQLPTIFSQTQNKTFDVTDYGVCDIVDILDGLVNSNIVVVSTIQNGKDILISIPKRRQTNSELEKTCIFAGEVVELFSNAPQYTILFQKFVRSYHYHFGYQCRLSDYGFQKLADLMEAVHGVVEMEQSNDEDKKIFLTSKVACRIFAEQLEELIQTNTGCATTSMKWDDVVKLHKKKFGYQIQPQTLGVKDIVQAIDQLPYIEKTEKDETIWITCHKGDNAFRSLSYKAISSLMSLESEKIEQNDHDISNNKLTLQDFITKLNEKFNCNTNEDTIRAMKHAIEICIEDECSYVMISKLMYFLMSVIQLLEQRTTMLLVEIKNALDSTINTTFEFGYPNLFSVLTAYSDIFYMQLGATLERSEIGLVPNSELRLSSCAGHNKHLYGSLKLPNTKLQKNVRPSRIPLVDHNSNRSANTQEPPAKTRAMSIDNNHNSSYAYSTSFGYRSQNTSNYHTQPSRTSTSCSKTSYFNNLSTSSSLYSTASHSNSTNTSMSNLSSNKENSFNSSFLINNSLSGSSNTSGSYCELNSNINSTVPSISGLQPNPQSSALHTANSIQFNEEKLSQAYPTSKLWDRRYGSYQQPSSTITSSNICTPVLAPLVMPTTLNQQTESFSLVAHPPSVPITSETSTGLYELVNNIQMCPTYQPPKPDTPPSENMPFWINPIWTNNNNTVKPRDDLLNIRLPELKALNVLPMLLSPYSLSKTENMKQVFNFESHDRKIA